MKALTKNKLAMGVGAIVGCMGMVPVANAVHFAPDGLGDALVNYYNVQERRTTLINYTNTSDKTIAMRVRLHEARNSRSVDFTVILSPYDVWNATIADGGGDVGPVIFTADNSCTIPRISQDGANPTRLKDAFIDAGVTDLTAMREGYVAAIVMGSKDGEPLTCQNGVSADDPDSETEFFVNKRIGGYAALLAQYPNYTNNAIKGVYNLLNVPLGQNAAAGMTTLADFFSSARPSAPYSSGAVPDYLPAALNGANLINLVTLQLDPGVIDGLGGMTPEQKYLASFNLPTLASANTFAYLLLGDNAVLSSDTPVNRVGAQAVSYLFARTNVINMWTAFQGATWDTATDLVVQSYVKQFYVDDGANPFSGRYPWKPGVPPLYAIDNGVATGPFASPFDGERSCDRVSWDIWDREENMDETPDSGRFSPTPAATDALCFETNRISFNKSYALGQPLAYNINSVFDNGWIDLDLRGAGNIYGTGQRPYNPIGAAPYYYGLPVDSFAFTTRVRDDGLNEAIIVPSAYKRNPEFNSVTMQINSY
jgi:hypothetical protein